MRHNFSKKVKEAALERSGGVCEAIGVLYGLEPGKRCTAILSQTKIEYDHYPLGAHAEGSNTLANCVAACQRCNQFKANHTDKAVEAKIKRVRIKHKLDPPRRKARPKIPQRPNPWPKGQKFPKALKRALRPSQP